MPSPQVIQKSLRVQIEFHPAQAEVASHPARFKVLFAGRRWGKTRLMVGVSVKRRLQKPGSLGWWVAPTYKQARIAFRYMRRLYFNSGIIKKANQGELSIEFVNDSVQEFKSGEILDNLVGEGLADVVVDESGTQHPDLWTLILRPMLMDTGGEADFIGTPRGMNWFWQLWVKGQGNDPDWKSWKFSSYANPFIKASEIKQAESEMPELVARQEIYAEPLENEGTVFRNVDALSVLKMQDPVEGETYAMGVDLAKYHDFTVISVTLGSKQVYWERFNKIDWAIQKDRIKAVSVKYNRARIVLDSTGVGDPIFEDLSRMGLQVDAFLFNSTSKRELIDNLIIKMDKKEIELLDNETQKGELKSYEYEITGGGRLKTNAPSGKFDDCVIACALSYWNPTPEPATALVINQGGRVRIVR